uniref:legumain n=1 Tax=Hemiscolopendra marginata TaxID=943146 RepID=A0A646QJ75_9MYRI
MDSLQKRFVDIAILFTLLSFVSCFDINRLNLPADGKIWALLVAGSNTYDNYRHQADICHAYQILHKHGIPDEQIVVMMYDDIAQSEENPTKGIIINHPNGEDVYQGTIKDYIKNDVTPENFLKILQGDQMAMKGKGSGKVINSGPSDHIFVYFADHGAPGLLAFPEGELHANDLIKVLNKMYNEKRYAKMVMYIEACESGSMFAKLLPNNINIFVTTAANPKESSYACYYDEQRETYLGDVYSVKWMEDSDKENLNSETLNKQFHIVKQETNTSHVQEYGDLSIAKLKVAEFQGAAACNCDTRLPEVPLGAVLSHEVPLMILKRKIMKANSFEEHSELKLKLKKMLRNRDFLSNVVKNIVNDATFSQDQANQILSDKFDLEDFDCYEKVARYFSSNCFALSKNDYALRHMYAFVNMCETGISVQKQMKAMEVACIFPPMYGIV